MNHNDVLLSIGRAKTLTKNMEDVNKKLSFYHSSPLSPATQMLIVFGINFLWVSVFVLLTYVSFWTLIAMPFVIYWFSGMKMTRKIESNVMRRKLEKYEDQIGNLLRERSHVVSELREVTGLADRFFTVANMDLFEEFILAGKANNFQECASFIA